MTIETFIATILPSLCVSIIMGIYSRGQTKRDERIQTQEIQRKRSDALVLSLLLAVSKLSYAAAMAIKNGRPNGEIEEGIHQYQKAMDDFKKFERELVVEKSTSID